MSTWSTPSTRKMYEIGSEMERAADALPWFRPFKKRRLRKDGRAIRLAGALAGGTLPPDPRTWRQEAS